MKRDDIISVICKLRHCEDYKEITQDFLIDIIDDKYRVNFQKKDGKLVEFKVAVIEGVLNENN